MSKFPHSQISKYNWGVLGTSDARCVYCRQQAVDPAWRPFCSERCKMTDLGRWLTGGYRVPAAEHESDEDDPAAAQDGEAT